MATAPGTILYRGSRDELNEMCRVKDDRIAELEREVAAWRNWFADIQADFGGVTDDCLNPSRIHDWNWIANYRPSPADSK